MFKTNNLLRTCSCYNVRSIRFKSKEHWSSKKLKPKDRALDQFDDFYGNVYGEKWKSIRVALLSPNKYCALVNNYGDTKETMQDLENNGALNIRTIFKLNQEKILETENETFDSEKHLKIYKLESQLNKIKEDKVQQEMEHVYGEKLKPGTELDVHRSDSENFTDQSDVKKDFSMKSSLESAQYDYSRIISPDLGLTNSALYEYIPATKLKGMEDWILESDHYRYYENSSEFPVVIERETTLNFPEQLQIYSYERGNVERFKSPRKCSTGVLDKYLLDGSSLLPVLALDLKPGDNVLDMCAAPGGKSLLIFQTLYPNYLLCNDIQESRVKRIQNVFKQYLYDFDKWRDTIVIRMGDARTFTDMNFFDKILVDVPCTTDRHVVNENDNNIFKPTRTKERLRLPEIQADILVKALKLVKPGGTVVYSTCSLSPIQNDGVVHMALKRMWEETDYEIIVKDLSTALKPIEYFYNLDNKLGLKYGHIVTPFLPNNFGPMYFCKINRLDSKT